MTSITSITPITSIKKNLALALLCTFFVTSPTFSKTLTSNHMDLLNGSLESMPYVLARMKLSHKGARRVLRNLKKGEKIDIKEQLKHIFDPVKEFFTEIRKHASLVTPLLYESLDKGKKEHEALSYLSQFMTSTLAIEPFFEQKIQTEEALEKICLEVTTFFSDIEESISDKAHKEYAKFIKKIRAMKKLTHAIIGENKHL